MMRGALPVAACLLVTPASLPLAAQDYRVRLDARAQSVAFRGLVSDSIPVGMVVTGPDGGPQTPDGHAVRCGAGDYCFFFRPGPTLRGAPMTTTATATVWGLGMDGLSLRATGRFVTDLGSDDVWPATEPAAQLLEGYLEYQRSAIVARAGRLQLASRLESLGFDGAWLRGRWDRAALEITGYGGWGLGQAAVVPVTNPALNPLDEWRPRDRQIVLGAEAAWLYRTLELHAEYRRELDPEDYYFVSERAALSFGAHVARLRLSGGADYNIAEGHLGNADATVTWLRPRFSLSAGARRYRPYFSLWTLWGAFSPVPYHALNFSAQVRAYDWLTLHGRGERYRYDDAEVTTGLVPQLEDSGWRTRIGATATNGAWTFDANYGAEYGPGAAARSIDAAVTFAPGERYSVDLYGGRLQRPLELRFYDARTRWIGSRAQLQLGDRRRLWTDVAYVGDNRDRPDAGAWSLSQFRARAGVTVMFGSDADRTPLPPARPPFPPPRTPLHPEATPSSASKAPQEATRPAGPPTEPGNP